ncbi:unnamed protein product [Cochlearia groenlandica]
MELGQKNLCRKSSQQGGVVRRVLLATAAVQVIGFKTCFFGSKLSAHEENHKVDKENQFCSKIKVNEFEGVSYLVNEVIWEVVSGMKTMKVQEHHWRVEFITIATFKMVYKLGSRWRLWDYDPNLKLKFNASWKEEE